MAENDKILVVEDDRTLLNVLRYNLTKEGYSVVTAIDGVEALEVARRDKPDFIILDIMLPKMSGFEVCRILRKEMTVPILMLTAKTEEIDKVVGLEIGADDYMTKPFSMRELLARIRAMLRHSLDAFVSRDAEVAKKVSTEDDLVDHLHDQVFRELLVFMAEDPKTITRATRLILVAHNLERTRPMTIKHLHQHL